MWVGKLVLLSQLTLKLPYIIMGSRNVSVLASHYYVVIIILS